MQVFVKAKVILDCRNGVLKIEIPTDTLAAAQCTDLEIQTALNSGPPSEVARKIRRSTIPGPAFD